MKLQLAIDLLEKEAAVELAKGVEEFVDIIEIGTPVVINEGLAAVSFMQQATKADTQVMADLKIMDAASYEVAQAAKYGADITTILGVAEDASIKGAIEEAHNQGIEILVDMIGVQDLETRAKELDSMGADYIAVHTGYDLQAEGVTPLDSLRTVKAAITNSKVAVAGGIDESTIEGVAKEQPDLIIAGKGIANAENPKEMAKKFRQIMDGQ